MEIYKYPQPSRFGSGYGMINFIPKYMTEEGTEFRVGFEGGSHGTLAQNVGAGAKQGPWDIYAAQSYIRTDGHVAHSKADQSSYYVNAGFQAVENWSIRLMANYVDASTQAPHNPLTNARSYPQRFDTETTLVTLTLANEYKQASGYIKGYYNNTNFYLVDESTGGGVGNAISKQSNDLYGIRARETFRLWEGSEIVTGLDLDKMDLENRQNRHDGGLNRVWDFPSVTVFSPYMAISQRFGSEDSFHIIPSAGLRYYHNSEFESKTAPQAGLIIGYANTNLNANYARGVNYPSPVVLQNFLANTSLPSGFDTKKIKPEIVDHYEIGLNHTWEGLATLGATYFYDKGKDRTRAYMFGGIPDESFFNSTTSRYKIRGVELSGSLTPIDGVELFAGATWLNAKATGDDGEKRNKMPYTPSFALQAGFKWNFYDNFTLSGDYQHLRDVYAATSMRTSDPSAPSSSFADLTDIDKLRDINVVNMRLDYAFNYEPLQIKEGKVFFAVDNIFDAKYAYSLAKDNAGQRAFYYMPGITFMLGMDLKF
jgi:iron complex outermembrane receptor protein